MRLLYPLILASSLAGCTDQVNESDSTQDVVSHNRLAVNRLAVNHLFANHLIADRLGTDPLGTSSFALNPTTTADLLATADGRDVLTYIVGCALPAGVSLVAPDGTIFNGEIGVAPTWVGHQLESSGQGWVSACLFARVNAHNTSVPISIRGLGRDLATTAAERAGYTLQEGAFYGQYFTPATDPINWIACSGADDVSAEQRDCARPDPANPGLTLCGFHYAGTCDGSPKACSHYDTHLFFQNCRDQGGGPFNEVISTFVQPL